MSAYAVENRRKRWFTGEEHTKYEIKRFHSDAEEDSECGFRTKHGYEAYVVRRLCPGFYVWDSCPDDWDITTSASPYQVKELFPRHR